MVLLLDNYDSFTYILRDYILQCGQACTVLRNDEKTIGEIEAKTFSSIVISPGPKTPDEAGITMPLIARFYKEKPILGICLGHQAIGEFFGASLVRAAKPMHGKTSVITHNKSFVFQNLPDSIEVMRYHSLVLTDMKKTILETTSVTAENEIMSIAHPTLPIAGLQFHPESVLTPNGLSILKNWFAHIR